MIQSFADKDTERLFMGRRVRRFGPDLTTRALQKLLMINAANDQYRICFTWSPTGPEQVEITDYH